MMTRPCFLPLVVLSLLAAAPLNAQRTDESRNQERIHARARETVAGLRENLRDARRLLVDIDDRRLREQLEVLLSRAALKADDLQDLLGVTANARLREPVSAEDFARLLKELKQQSFDSNRVDFIETFVKDRPLNCRQATEVVKTLSFDEGRTKAAIMMYPSLLDPENFFEVLKVFPFDSSRRQVMEAVKKENGDRE